MQKACSKSDAFEYINLNSHTTMKELIEFLEGNCSRYGYSGHIEFKRGKFYSGIIEYNGDKIVIVKGDYILLHNGIRLDFITCEEFNDRKYKIYQP